MLSKSRVARKKFRLAANLLLVLFLFSLVGLNVPVSFTDDIGFTVLEANNESEAVYLGDVNGDGIISVKDAIEVLRHIVGLTNLDEEQLTRAMVNDGKTLTIHDAILILRKVAGLISEFPIDVQENPFLVPYNTPFGVPPFDEIKNEHFLPAFIEGIRQEEEVIDAIINNPAPPTFDNTIVPLAYSQSLIYKVGLVFYNLLSSIGNDELDEIAAEMGVMLAEHEDNIVLNIDLFNCITEVYAQKQQLNLSEEDEMLLENTYLRFYQNGAALLENERDRLREINQSLSLLSLRFSQNVMSDVEDFKLFVEDEEELKGLPGNIIDTAAAEAAAEGREGSWLFTLSAPSVMPLLTYAENRDLRRKMAEAYISRGGNDNDNNNVDIINQIIELRLEKSQMLGHENYASYALENSMAGDPETVETFLLELWEAALPVAREEGALLQEMIYTDGYDFDLAFWDWRYYAEKVRREQYDVDELAVSEYFELNNVIKGFFTVVERLWGLQFVQREDLPLYHPDTSAWEVLEADGTHIGILYMDLLARPNKQSGAWMHHFRYQHIKPDEGFVHPIITIFCNFPSPSGGRPTLLNFYEVNTLFHELGHALHSLLSNVHYPSLSGINVPMDFVELPSQIMENWAKHPEVLKMFARHYETGETISAELLERIEGANKFNQGFTVVEMLSSAILDMEYHTITAYEPIEPDNFEQMVKERYGMLDEIYFRHGSTHFRHIISLGYSARYYSYLWAGMLDADAFEAFVETGDIFDQETADRFREEILSRGGTRDAMEMYIAFRGREPKIEAYLKQRGLVPGKNGDGSFRDHSEVLAKNLRLSSNKAKSKS